MSIIEELFDDSKREYRKKKRESKIMEFIKDFKVSQEGFFVAVRRKEINTEIPGNEEASREYYQDQTEINRNIIFYLIEVLHECRDLIKKYDLNFDFDKIFELENKKAHLNLEEEQTNFREMKRQVEKEFKKRKKELEERAKEINEINKQNQAYAELIRKGLLEEKIKEEVKKEQKKINKSKELQDYVDNYLNNLEKNRKNKFISL